MQTELEDLRKLPVAERRASELEANPDIALTRKQLWERVDRTNG